MTATTLRQLAALLALGAALMNLGVALKFAIFTNVQSSDQSLLVALMFFFGFALWGIGCRLARLGARPVRVLAAAKY